MRGSYRMVLGMAVAGLLLLTLIVGGGSPAGPAAAGPEQQEPGSRSFVQIFVEKLAAEFSVDQERLLSAVKTAALRSVDELVAEGELTEKQATRVKACVQQREAVQFHQCIMRYHGGMSGPGHMGPMRDQDGKGEGQGGNGGGGGQ